MKCMKQGEVDGQTHHCELPKGHEGSHKCGWYADGCYAVWSDAPQSPALPSAARAALEVLRAVEWVGEGTEDGEPNYCKVCRFYTTHGHRDGCALAAAIRDLEAAL